MTNDGYRDPRRVDAGLIVLVPFGSICSAVMPVGIGGAPPAYGVLVVHIFLVGTLSTVGLRMLGGVLGISVKQGLLCTACLGADSPAE